MVIINLIILVNNNDDEIEEPTKLNRK